MRKFLFGKLNLSREVRELSHDLNLTFQFAKLKFFREKNATLDLRPFAGV